MVVVVFYDFASHSVDMMNYLVGPPEKIQGTVLKSIYSETVEDSVYSTFVYPNNLSGLIMSNWSDASYRKPNFKLELFGQEGKIIADMHAIKVFVREDKGGLTKGWNTLYITDFGKPVRFYVRGGEFTSQLDYFIDCILKETPGDICNFEDGLMTDMVISNIFKNGAEQA